MAELERLPVLTAKAEESRLVGSGAPPPPDPGDLVAGTWDFYPYLYVGFI